MARQYTISGSADIANADGDTDLVEILPADDKPVRLCGMVIGQMSEVGDSAEEGVRVSVIRLPATVTSGSGGAAATAQPLDSATAAAGLAAEIDNSTVATTTGTAVTLDEMGWNIRNTPFERWWPEEKWQPIVRQGEALVVRMQTTVADTVTFQYTFYVEEV
jgi:hypothetical protein